MNVWLLVFVLQDESGYFSFFELNVRNDYGGGAGDSRVAYIEAHFFKPKISSQRVWSTFTKTC